VEDRQHLASDPNHSEAIPARPWYLHKRVYGLPLMLLIFAMMLWPVIKKWGKVRPFIAKTDLATFFFACGIFAIFLFARSLIWRRILKGFGHDLPLAPATRIWISSELARYVPSSVGQFIGRVMMAKPYGVPRRVVLSSQILELSAFLLANVILAVACLAFNVAKIDGKARPWMLLTICLAPTLALFLHPKIFYPIVNRFATEPITKRPSGRILIALLFGSLVALIWQSIAIWLLTHEALHLEWQHWWYVAGAYCLAWIAGFLSFLSPGGLGVREAVFYFALRAILPSHIKDQFGADRDTFNTYIEFLAVLLRLWTIVGELILWSTFNALDWRGATGRPDAPGRVPTAPTPAAEEDRAAPRAAGGAAASPS
jgi:glycosyltransferase 2 family protein